MSGGKKLDSGKAPFDLIPHDALVEVAKVLDFGKQKYDAHNWKKGIAYSRVLAAAYRHMGEYNEGRRTDSETGLSHLAHAATNLLFLLWYEKHRPEMDDLYKPQAPEVIDETFIKKVSEEVDKKLSTQEIFEIAAELQSRGR